MVDIIRAGYDQLIRAPTKTITFTGGAGAGAVGSAVTIWTLTGRVMLFHITCFCTTTVVSTAGTGTIALGVATTTSAFVSTTTMGAGTLAANDWWNGANSTPAEIGQEILPFSAGAPQTLNESIIITVATNAITSGVLVFDCWYRSLTTGGSLS